MKIKMTTTIIIIVCKFWLFDIFCKTIPRFLKQSVCIEIGFRSHIEMNLFIYKLLALGSLAITKSKIVKL